MPFNFSGNGEIVGINIRRGNADDSDVTVDLKLTMTNVPVLSVASILGTENTDRILSSFFDDDRDENRLFFNVDHLVCNAKFKEKHTLGLAHTSKVRVDKLNKFKIYPVAGSLFNVDSTAQISNPPANYIEVLAERMNMECAISLEQDAELI